jgi:hypothetical protein
MLGWVLFLFDQQSIPISSQKTKTKEIRLLVQVIYVYYLSVLVRKRDASKVWATKFLIAQIVLLVCTFILIRIKSNYIQTSGYDYPDLVTLITDGSLNKYVAKYRITEAQLVFGILLMFSGFTFVGIYIYVTIIS